MPDLDIREILVLRGPNIWANYPVIEAWVDLGELKDSSSEEIPGFSERLKSWLPGMVEHRCSEGERGGFFQRLDRGTYPAHILEHVTIELQICAGHQVGYGKARHTCVDGLYKVVVRYLDEVVAQECLRTGRRLLLAAYAGEPFDVLGEIEMLRDVVDHNALGPSMKSMIDAAKERGIPWRRLQEGRSLVQLGHGVKQRRIWTAETDRTAAIAEHVAQDKELTRATLKRVGVPAPEGRLVVDADDAWSAAEEMGLPVVVKPRNANHGRGVFIDLETREQIQKAFPDAAKNGDGVLVEKFIRGVGHQALVVDGKFVAATRGEPAMVIGDGKRTIFELVEQQLNSDPRRGPHDTAAWAKVDTGDPTVLVDLERQGHTPESIPAENESVLVSRFSNPAIDVTQKVHPSTRELLCTAALAVGLDIASMDLVCVDISKPLDEQGGAIVEVNASPSLHAYIEQRGQGPDTVGGAIIDMMFPTGEDGRVPIVGVAGTHGKTSVVRLIAHLLAPMGKRLGVATTGNLRFGRRAVESTQGDRHCGSRGVLFHPWTELAVCEVSTETILREGVGFDRCQVGVVTNVDRDQLGMNYIDTLEQMAKVKRCIVDIVMPGGAAVLNADDALVAEMASYCQGSVIYHSRSDSSPLIHSHLQAGGRAAFVREDAIILAEGDTERVLCALSAVAMPLQTPFTFHVENVLSATCATWALGLEDAVMAAGLASYGSAEGGELAQNSADTFAVA